MTIDAGIVWITERPVEKSCSCSREVLRGAKEYRTFRAEHFDFDMLERFGRLIVVGNTT